MFARCETGDPTKCVRYSSLGIVRPLLYTWQILLDACIVNQSHKGEIFLFQDIFHFAHSGFY